MCHGHPVVWSSSPRHNAPQALWQDYVENSCPPGFRPFPGTPLVDQVIEELLQLQLAQQETNLSSSPWGLRPKVGTKEEFEHSIFSFGNSQIVRISTTPYSGIRHLKRNSCPSSINMFFLLLEKLNPAEKSP